MTEQEQQQMQEAQPIAFADLAIHSLPGWVREKLYGKRLLDAGCSTGSGTHRLAEALRLVEVTGVDNVGWHVSLAYARYIRNRKYRWVNADAFDGELTFDAEILYCSNTLEHFDAPWIYFHNLLTCMPNLETVLLVLPYNEKYPLVEGHKVSFNLRENIPWQFTYRVAETHELKTLHLVSVAIKNLNSTGFWGGEQIVLAYHKHT